MPSCASDPLAARARTICAPSVLSGGCEGRASATRAAILAVAIAIALPTSVAAHGDWPEGPHRHWFEGLQRPDNHLHPYRQFDQKSLFCCGAADVVKTRFKVENAGDRHPEDVWYAWLAGPGFLPRRSSKTTLRTGTLTCSCWLGRSSASCARRAGCDAHHCTCCGVDRLARARWR
jgi:hypothetical protein